MFCDSMLLLQRCLKITAIIVSFKKIAVSLTVLLICSATAKRCLFYPTLFSVYEQNFVVFPAWLVAFMHEFLFAVSEILFIFGAAVGFFFASMLVSPNFLCCSFTKCFFLGGWSAHSEVISHYI